MLKKEIGMFNIFLNSEIFEQKMMEKGKKDPYNLLNGISEDEDEMKKLYLFKAVSEFYDKLPDKADYELVKTASYKIRYDLEHRMRIILDYIDKHVQDTRQQYSQDIFKLLSS
jgi:hypothetical protein